MGVRITFIISENNLIFKTLDNLKVCIYTLYHKPIHTRNHNRSSLKIYH